MERLTQGLGLGSIITEAPPNPEIVKTEKEEIRPHGSEGMTESPGHGHRALAGYPWGDLI